MSKRRPRSRLALAAQVQQNILVSREKEKKAAMEQAARHRKDTRNSLSTAASNVAEEQDFDVSVEDIVNGKVPLSSIPRPERPAMKSAKRRLKVCMGKRGGGGGVTVYSVCSMCSVSLRGEKFVFYANRDVPLPTSFSHLNQPNPFT